MNRVGKAEILKIGEGTPELKPDLIAVEEPLEIRIGFGEESQREQRSISVTMRTPGHDFELALGFLFTENIISDHDEVVSIRYCYDAGKQEERENVVRVELSPAVKIDFKKIERHFYTSSSCGVCSKTSIDAVKTGCPVLNSDLRIDENIIHQAPATLRHEQQVFEYTGGLHAAGLFNEKGDLIIMREDVGRHNALDKLVGAALVKQMVPLSDYFVLVSGRASFELVQKSLMAGIPLMAAVGAPSSLAVALAEDFNMTLLGFVRNQSFNVYCGRERLTYENKN
ncbi:formate dehydrogenase accessory sulfurtransferase FdhD [Fulvivirga ulvae]|uniref:formate dehydrogenase accessory sulfurtransferase FdhD n=1 Tax=Fulvivirga ulvae TaxID=2904245 RepID=UPI001F269A51|nr:formate dehydrogenase accessory sulfurtransferase FdhD [Fulvivirga ulvae]UII32383.1 formate dehydrogenase accessory sulfurtransferase FdhD [Fulvivirga ulvae]